MSISKTAVRGAVLATGASVALGLLGPTPAYAANDWEDVTDLLPTIPDTQDSRWGVLDYQGGWVSATIGWNGTQKVWLDIRADDTRADGYGVAGQVRYQVYRSGQWSGWQYRTAVKATGTPDPSVHRIYENRAPIKNVHVRGCYFNGSGLVNCDNSWH